MYKKYFDILNLNPTSNINIIKKKYRYLSLYYNTEVKDEDKLIEITNAYELLLNNISDISNNHIIIIISS